MPTDSPHPIEDRYQHFLAYSNLEHSDLLRYAYYQGVGEDTTGIWQPPAIVSD